MAEWFVDTSEEKIDELLEKMEAFESFPHIVEAAYRPEPELSFLMLKLSDGRRLLIPKEELSELKNATDEQAADLFIAGGLHLWWPQLDDGLYLPTFLEKRWSKRGSEGRFFPLRPQEKEYAQAEEGVGAEKARSSA